MAVVIDEMEVVPAERETVPGSEALPAGSGPQQEKLKDHEVERMMQHQVERSERIWAH